MKRTLTALTVAATMFASSASAFELNTTITEENRITGKRMVGDLTVGVKALILSWYNSGCGLDGKMHLFSDTEIVTELDSYTEYYQIQLETDGEFTMTYGPTKKGGKELPDLPYAQCSNILELDHDTTFIPVKSINGFTDRRSFFVDLINQGYE